MDKCGNYYIEDIRLLGRGGFGEVFEVDLFNLTKSNTKKYARKYFSPSPENNNTQVKEIADLRQRFIVEIKTQYKLNSINYNAIAPIVLFNTEGNKPYFVMELAECSLEDAIKNGMSEYEKATSIQSILRGLYTIHDYHYIHRDLNPRNVLRYSDNKFKITDFGLVKDMDDLRAEIKTKFAPTGIGTDGYRAPESRDFGRFTVQSDIYAIGKIISDVYGENNHKVRDIITKCQAYFPEKRYESVLELSNEFFIAVKDELDEGVLCD